MEMPHVVVAIGNLQLAVADSDGVRLSLQHDTVRFTAMTMRR
jgi:hypothetical protein